MNNQIDFNSPAELGGLREGDMIVAVNGTPIKNKTHQEVVVLIKEKPNETVLHVVDAESKQHFEKEGLPMYDLEEMQKYTHEFVTSDSMSPGEIVFVKLYTLISVKLFSPLSAPIKLNCLKLS